MFTVRYGLISSIKQITFCLLKVKLKKGSAGLPETLIQFNKLFYIRPHNTIQSSYVTSRYFASYQLFMDSYLSPLISKESKLFKHRINYLQLTPLMSRSFKLISPTRNATAPWTHGRSLSLFRLQKALVRLRNINLPRRLILYLQIQKNL